MVNNEVGRFTGLTIVMPNYNHAEFLMRSIGSVVSQNCLPAEFIILDDASTDRSWEIISEYSEQYEWIRIFRNEENLGVLESVRRLIEWVNTDYIWFFSADDMIASGAILLARDAAQSYPQVGVIFGQMQCVDDADQLLNCFSASHWPEPGYRTPTQFMNEFLATEPATNSLFLSCILRVQAWKDVGGFNENLKSWMDTYSMWCCGLKYGVYYTAAPAACWRKLEGSHSSAQSADLSIVVELVEEAVACMLSDAHKALFPEAFVKQWAVNYLAIRYQQYTQAVTGAGPFVLQEQVAALKAFGAVLSGSRLSSFIGQQPLVSLLNHFKEILVKSK